jgi:hypothetical protein
MTTHVSAYRRPPPLSRERRSVASWAPSSATVYPPRRPPPGPSASVAESRRSPDGRLIGAFRSVYRSVSVRLLVWTWPPVSVPVTLMVTVPGVPPDRNVIVAVNFFESYRTVLTE